MRELKKVEEGKYRLKACLQSTGVWDAFNYPQEYIKEVFLLTGHYFTHPCFKDGTHLFLMVNDTDNESIWSGDLLVETEVLVKMTKGVWSSEKPEADYD